MAALTLKNPHSVLAALGRRPEDVLEIRVPRRVSPAWQTVAEQAARRGVPVGMAGPSQSRPHKGGRKGKEGREGGSEATVREREPVDVHDLLSPLSNGEEQHRLWLALDQIQDPHNLGAIFRTAAFFGIAGIVLTRHKSAPLTGVAYDVASGGIESVPFSVVANLQQTFEVAKQQNVWILGTSEHTEQSVRQVDRDRSWMVVVGNEESGLRRLTLDCCDENLPNPR